MRKLFFFLPAAVFTLIYGWLASSLKGAVQPATIIWLAPFWIAGWLLSQSIYWGGLIGMIPAIYMIYLGSQETGQIINATPMAIVILIYYAGAIYLAYKNSHRQSIR